MRSIIRHAVLPLLCGIAFISGSVGAIQLSMPQAENSDLDTLPNPVSDFETLQHSYPVYNDTVQLGHCVLGIRSPQVETEAIFADPNGVERQGEIYKIASALLRTVEDPETACSQFAQKVAQIAEVTEGSFLIN